jgi:toxin HigB-1
MRLRLAPALALAFAPAPAPALAFAPAPAPAFAPAPAPTFAPAPTLAGTVLTVARKLSALDYASDLRDLSCPGNHLEKLKGALGGRYSIRINDPFRIIFSFDRGEASHLAIVDYHR